MLLAMDAAGSGRGPATAAQGFERTAIPIAFALRRILPNLATSRIVEIIGREFTSKFRNIPIAQLSTNWLGRPHWRTVVVPWRLLHDWYAKGRYPGTGPLMPLSLITLNGRPGTSEEEIAFYARAEFDMLVEWASNGLFVMAFIGHDRDELTLLCTESAAVMRDHVMALPLIVAGLADADVRVVSMLRLATQTTIVH